MDGAVTNGRGASTAGDMDGTKIDNPYRPTLGNVINQFKIMCTKRIRGSSFLDSAWQSRFYDHILHMEIDLHTVRRHIQDNPLRWLQDRHYTKEP